MGTDGYGRLSHSTYYFLFLLLNLRTTIMHGRLIRCCESRSNQETYTVKDVDEKIAKVRRMSHVRVVEIELTV
jgi:hypothetical protein